MDFPKVLRAWRGEMYKKEAASKLSITLGRYKSWESGDRKPDPIVLVEMLRRMGLSND